MSIPSVLTYVEKQDTPREQIERAARTLFPNGHPKFVSIVLDNLALHNTKNHDYAKGGDPLGNFQRVANILAQYPNFPFASPEGVALIYALKQVDSVMWGLSQNIKHQVEGFAGRTRDVSNYFNIVECILDEKGKV